MCKLVRVKIFEKSRKVKKRYRIEPAENGDVTLQLDKRNASPENLFAAALEFLYEHPQYFLGSSTIVHPERKNVIYAAYATGGRAILHFHSKENVAKNPAVEGYAYFDHAQFQHILQTMAQAARDIRQAIVQAPVPA